MVVRYIITAVLAYLIGSVSTGLIVSRVFNGPNLREVGSKNTGASNVLRTMGVRSGLITFWGDCAKAAAACGLGWWICGTEGFQSGQYGAMLAGLMVILGHNWPVFFQLKGGKGVASSLGVMIITFPLLAIPCYVVGAAVIALTRFISLGSMTILTLFAILVCIFGAGGNWIIMVWAILLALMCIFRHRANIGRLIQGKENKLSFSKKK